MTEHMSQDERGERPDVGVAAARVRASQSEPATGTERPARRSRARTCVGCGARVLDRPSLLRLVLAPGGEVAVDAAGGGFGRGAHVHGRPDCLVRAAKGGLARAAKRAVSIRTAEAGLGSRLVPLDVDGLALAVEAATQARVERMIRAAARGGRVAAGDAFRPDDVGLLVVACDAGVAAELPEVRRAVAAGRAVAWGTKVQLGQICRVGRPGGVALVGIGEPKVAVAVRDAVHVIEACRAARRAPVAARGRGRHGRISNVVGSVKSGESRTERGA